MYEYKVVPAPARAAKVKGLKSTAERFSHAFAERLNAEAAGGWQFQRTETLSCEERSTLGRIKVTTQTVMVFARPVGELRPDAGAAIAAAQEANYESYDQPYDISNPPDYADDHAPAHDPEPEPAAPRQMGRQEPLFRANSLRRPESAGRAEPVLRPRAPRLDADTGDTD